MLAHEDAVRAARQVIERSPADETEVSVEAVVDAFVRFADVGPTQCADREKVEVAIRVRKDGREARASAGSLEPRDLRAALDRALRLAAVSSPAKDLVPLGGPVVVRETRAVRPTLDHGFDEKARLVATALDACRAHGLAPAGLVQTTGIARTLVNSAGREVTGSISRASFGLATTGRHGGSGLGNAIHADVREIDAEAAIARAVEKGRTSEHPEPCAPCETTVVLEPPAVSALLLFAAYQGFGAQEVEEEASFLCGRVGERVFAESVSVHDDAGHPMRLGFAFDGEGSPRERVALVDRGVPRGPVTDRASAARLCVANTGHARPQPSSEGPRAEHLVLASGDAADLLAGVEHGLLVSQVHYANVIDPRELLLTGMTRNGTFRIEHGEVGRPVRNLRFTQSLVEALARVSGIGASPCVAGALFDGETVVPAVRIDGFRFTSSAEF